ncbi:MAG: C1 family peptidase [Tangfeifania sp.]
MKKIALLLISIFFVVLTAQARNNPGSYSIKKEVKHTPVISQGSTGTCWSFATTSFLESEIMRKGFPETDLSEMYFVYYAYKNKARQYLLYHGNNNFGQGGQAHDVIDVLREHGMVSQAAFPGKTDDGRYRHRDLENELSKEVASLNKKRRKFDISNLKSLDSILKEHLGQVPNNVKTDDGNYSPDEFREKFDIDPSDYVELASFSHHPFYKPFVLEVPDNWSHALYYNLPIDELMEVMYHSIENGYTFCWDGDTSEKTFAHKNGEAEWNKKSGKIDQQMRQETFYDRSTTDDHLMHVVGLSTNDDGQSAFYTKNSWGPESNDFGGYLHMTENYVKLKTIAIMVHKDAIPKKIKRKLNL